MVRSRSIDLCILLAWLFLPFYVRSGVFTMPEFLEKRFGAKARWFLSLFSLVAYVLTKVSVTLYAGGIVISTLLGIDFMTGALATVILTGIYTVLGGMTVNSEVRPNYMNMWRSMNDNDYPWHWLVLSSSIVGIWYWCTDQVIVQRVLTAKNITEARRGSIFGAFLKLMPVFLFLIPGIIALVLKLRGELAYDTPDQAFPALMMQILPSGLRGLVAAGLMAALMSSLASVFNSCSTLFTIDIYKKLRPQATEPQMVRMGRIATGVVVLLGIAWVPVIEDLAGGALYGYLQSVQAYIAPPITAVFLLGIFFSRINNNGALATLFSGLAIAAIRLTLEVSKDSLDPTGFLFQIADMNFLKFSTFFFLFCVATAVVVSLLTPRQDKAMIKGLTFGTITEEQKAAEANSYTWVDIVASLFVVAVVAWVMIYFS